MQAAHVQQVADERVQPVGVVLDGGQQGRLVRLAPLHVGLAQAAGAGLDRGQRGAQVMADRGQQRGAHPVALGQRLGLSGLGAQPLAVQGRGGLGGEPDQQPGGGRLRMLRDEQGQILPDVDPGGAVHGIGDAAGRDRHPPVRHPLLQLGPAAKRAGQVVEDRGRRVGAAQHGLGQGEQRGGLVPAARRLQRPPRGQVDDTADRDRDGDEQQEGQQAG